MKINTTSSFSLGRYEGNPYEVTEWQILVHIIQGRDLPGFNLNPYVSIQIDQQKRYTNMYKSTNSPYFGEVQYRNSVLYFSISISLIASHI